MEKYAQHLSRHIILRHPILQRQNSNFLQQFLCHGARKHYFSHLYLYFLLKKKGEKGAVLNEGSGLKIAVDGNICILTHGLKKRNKTKTKTKSVSFILYAFLRYRDQGNSLFSSMCRVSLSSQVFVIQGRLFDLATNSISASSASPPPFRAS